MGIVKLDQLEHDHLRSMQEEQDSMAVEVGYLSLQIESLETKRDDILDKFNKLQKEQASFIEKLHEKYGDGEIDLVSGEFRKG